MKMQVFVARQPIFDRKRRIYAYELLFRGGMNNVFPDIDGDTATSQVLANSFFNIGLPRLTDNKRAFINFTAELLRKRIPSLFSRQELTVEVLETVEPEGDTLQALDELNRLGYELALDDFVYRPDLAPLLKLARIVKIDIRITPIDTLAVPAPPSGRGSIRLLAEKVETYEEFQQARAAGFELFQGYFFSKPEILEGKDIAPSQINLLQIIGEANRPDFDFRQLEKLINRDLSISYKLLRYINSAFFRRSREIGSIRQALVMLGEREIRQFISLVAAASLASGKPSELLRASIVRAKFCELLGNRCAHPAEGSELFLVGLFSMIDAMLDHPMSGLMAHLPLTDGIKKALCEQCGDLAHYLLLVQSYETGDWDRCLQLARSVAIDETLIPGCYLEAMAWADSLSSI
jgi:EAL and modified HD-GYP domain-containing signal transduction protein